MIKTFKGLLTDGEQEQIHLSGGDSDKGYRIVRFQLMPNLPATGGAQESIVKIYSVKQSSVDNIVDFSDDTLLASAIWLGNKNPAANVPAPFTDAMFDHDTVNQDIYITHIETDGSESVNYYLELEEVKMKDSEIAVVNYKAALLHGE